MQIKPMTDRHTKYLVPTVTFVCILLIWEFFPTIFKIPSYVFPKFSLIIHAMYLNRDNVFIHLKTTFIEAIGGLLIGTLSGFVLGILLAQSKTFSKITLPYIIATNAIPVIAIAPLVILWFGQGIFSKVMVAAFLCFFPILINTYKGINTYSNSYLDLFNIYGSTKYDFLMVFKLRNAFPFIIAGLKLSATYSVVGAVVAEFIGANAGLGFGMLQSIYSLNVPRLWGYILVSCILSITMYSIIYLIELSLINPNKHEFT